MRQRDADDRPRCTWTTSDPLYLRYHDVEWGTPVHGDDAVYERLVLESFQSGLSWLTILKKRANFRAAFAQFSIARVAEFGTRDIERLLADAGIVRNRAKITAALTNARAALTLPGGVSEFVWSHRPEHRAGTDAPDAAQLIPEAIALARGLKQHGFAFVGPTTAQSTMQAIGVVNAHERHCFRYSELLVP